MTGPAELEPDDHPHAAAAGDLGTVTDDEYFEGLPDVDLVDAATGQPVDGTEGVQDLRGDPDEARGRRRAAGDRLDP